MLPMETRRLVDKLIATLDKVASSTPDTAIRLRAENAYDALVRFLDEATRAEWGAAARAEALQDEEERGRVMDMA